MLDSADAMQICYLFTASICFAALLGDKLLEFVARDELRAFVDSCTHGLVGSFSWAATLTYLRTRRFTLTGSKTADVVLCGIIASLIDLDHFYAAKSFSLKAALSLDQRPPLHCTSYWIFALSCALLISVVVKAEWLATLTWITVVAVLSHHIRDATRRGLWLWPLGSTPPIPYFGYIFLLAVLPLVTAYAVFQPASYAETVTTV